MNDLGFASLWLLRTLLAGGALLFAAWIALHFTSDPARRQRLAAWSFRAALLAAVLGAFPAWLTIPLTRSTPAAVVVEQRPEQEPTFVVAEMVPQFEEFTEEAVVVPLDPIVETAEPAEVAAAPWWSWLPLIYAVIASLAVLQLLVALVGLMRLRRSSTPAPDAVVRQARTLLPQAQPGVRVSSRLLSPVCFGWLRPTVLLPQSLVESARPQELHWALAHELDHLRRGDPRTGLWVGMARVLYFAVPWFWAVRRELHLAQEYLADAAAAAGRPADYAAFLVSLSGPPAPQRLPLGAVGVRAGRSDLFRRVSMLTQENRPVRDSVSRTWSLFTAGGALAAAVVFSGLGFADEPKPRKVEVEVVIGDDGKPRETRKDGDKPKAERKDGEKKVEMRRMEFKIAGPEEMQKLSKAVSAALEKGDVVAANEAMAKLQAALAHQPNVMMLHGGGFMPSQAPPPPTATVRMRKVDDETMTMMEEKLESLQKALASVKGIPEASEAIERTIMEFKKKLTEAYGHGESRMPEDAAPRARRFEGAADPHLKEIEAQAVVGRAKAEAALKALEAKLKAADSDEARQKLKAQLAEARAAIEHMKFRDFAPRRFEANPFGSGGQGAILSLPPLRAPGEGRLGISIAAVPDVLVDQFDLPKGRGVIITAVREGSPAAKAGLRANDVLLKVATLEVAGTAEDVIKSVAKLESDSKFDVLVLRKGKKETIKDVLIPAPKKREASGGASGGSGKRDADTVKFKSMNVNVSDGVFKIEAISADGGKYRISGRLADGTPVPMKIEVGHGDDEKESTLEKLSKEDRAAVEQLLKNVGGGRR